MSGSSDLPTGNEWELSKENVQPLKHGRKVSSLSAALAPSSADYQLKIYSEKQVFEAEIRTYRGNDPLDTWYRYIQWTNEHFPKGGKDACTLLERCIELFKDDKEYRNDERYLKIWLRYADLCGEPLEIFNYMHSQSICSGLAQFYEAWAFVLESVGNTKKADEVYNLGIHRKAYPLERLQQLHRSFQVRLVESIESHMHSPVEMIDQTEQRNPLCGLKSSKKGNVSVKRTGKALSGHKNGIGPSVQKSNTGGNGFAIFQDNASIGPNSSLPPSTGEWQAPPTVPSITRENTQKPGQWSSVKVEVPQGHYEYGTSVQRQAFEVHVDSEEPSSRLLHNQQHVVMDKVLSARKPEKPHSVMVTLQKTENTEDKKFKVMYCKDKVYAGTEEFSFEELRAARIFAAFETSRCTKKTPQYEEVKQTNFRVMYPKNEVYSFYGERQLEEVCLERYSAYKEKKRKAKEMREGSLSPVHYSQIQPRGQSQQAVGIYNRPSVDPPSLVAPPTEMPQLQYQSLVLDRNVSFCDQDKSMEIASCQKVNNLVKDCSDQPQDLVANIPEERKVTAKKSLSFGNGEIRNENCQSLLQRNFAATTCDQSYGDPIVPNSSLLHNGTGSSSAFKPVSKNQAQQFSATPGFQIFDESLSSSEKQRISTASAMVKQEQSNIMSEVDYELASSSNTSMLAAVKKTQGGIDTPKLAKDTSFKSGGSKENQFNKFCSQTPDMLTELNSSHLTGPSPTVNTKIARQEILAMFNNPIGSDKNNSMCSLGDNDQEFEAAFSNEKDNKNSGGIKTQQGFIIFNDADQMNEDQENRPPVNYQEGPKHRSLGILQPSVDIPTGPPEEVEVSDEDEDQMESDKENELVAKNRQCDQDSKLPEKIKELSVADLTQEHTFASSSFNVAARMFSTPFPGSEAQAELPCIPWSNVRCKPVENHFTGPDKQLKSTSAENSFPVVAQMPVDQKVPSFSCTPSKILSPIIERSDEDLKSTGSSMSSHHSTGSGARSSSSLNITQNTVVPAPNLPIVEQQNKTQNEDNQLAQEFSILILGDPSQEMTFHLDGSTDINPFHDVVTSKLLLRVDPPISSYDGYFVTEDELPRIGVNMAVNLGNELYRVEKQVGSGAFAKVYRAKPLSADMYADDNDDCNNLVLKVQKCSSVWELYICRQLHQRMSSLGCEKDLDLHLAVMHPHHAYEYSNGSVLVSSYHWMGTLLDVVNKYKMVNEKMNEAVVLYYTINILRILEACHKCGIIHGDIKPDNFLVIENEDSDSSGQEVETVLKLIDFGRAVDLHLFPEGTTFTANCYTDSFQCVEMKIGRPWTYQVDTFGLVGTVFCVMFGEYMKVYQQAGRWKINKAVKRHFNTNLWNNFFDSFLNIPNCQQQPSLTEMRKKFEDYYHQQQRGFKQQMDKHEIFMFET